MLDLSQEKLKQSLLFICNAHKKAGAYGLAFFQFIGNNNPLGKRQAQRNKVIVPLKENEGVSIESRVDRLVKIMLKSSRPGTDMDIMIRANWFFLEYTPITANLTSVTHLIKSQDFKGFKKHVIYFDMDLKDNIPKEALALMTEEEKINYITKHGESYKKLMSTDPLYIMFSGGGFHIGYYADNLLFSSKQWKVSEDAYVEAYKKELDRLKSLTGWIFDPKCSNLNRIDRVPFTYNVKTPIPEEDSFASLLYSNINAGHSFTDSIVQYVETPEIRRRAADDALLKPPLYSTMATFRDMNPYAYKYLFANVSFRKVFDYFGITDQLCFPKTDDSSFTGFKSCLSPFRSNILGRKVTAETQPSFRYDETTKKFWDFGVIPHSDSGAGDIVGLAWGLKEFKEKGLWPDKINVQEAVDFSLTILGTKTVSDLRGEMTGFIRDDKTGIVQADYNSVLRVIINIITNKYELVFNKVQKQFFFRNNGTKDAFKPFPWDCAEFGSMDKSESARLLLMISGVGNPTPALQSTAKLIVGLILNPSAIVLSHDGYTARFDVEAIKDITFPVIDQDNPVLRFTDDVYYHLRTGSTSTEYAGYAYGVGVAYNDLWKEESTCPNFDMLLTGLVGPEDSAGRMAFKYILAQMWFKAGGDSRALVVKGYGRNGKSTLVKVLTNVLPQGVTFNCDMDTLSGTSTASTATRMDLLGKHLVIVGDVTDYNLDLKLKPLIVGDAGITAKLLFKNPVSFKNTATFLFMTNSFPKITQDISAFLRRFILVESKIKIKKVIPNLEDVILESEKPGIWKYILTAVEYFRVHHNFVFPEHEEWAQSIITPMKKALLNQFPSGELALCITPKIGSVLDLRALYRLYIEYSDQIGDRKSGLKSFSTRIASIVEMDNEVYGEDWKPVFDASGMDEYFVVMYKHGQAEYIINADFSIPLIGIATPGKLTGDLNTILAMKNVASDVRMQSVKYPNQPSSEVVAKLKKWRDSGNSRTAQGVIPMHPVSVKQPSVPSGTVDKYELTGTGGEGSAGDDLL